jgi:hypothetical protein
MTLASGNAVAGNLFILGAVNDYLTIQNTKKF